MRAKTITKTSIAQIHQLPRKTFAKRIKIKMTMIPINLPKVVS